MTGDSGPEPTGRTKPGVAKRIVTTTTIAPTTHDFFAEHPEYTMGRCLDLWVADQRGKEIEEQVKTFERLAASLDVGGCVCGRLLRARPTRVGPEGMCLGCNRLPADCDCQVAERLRQRRLLDWQRIRAEAGLETSHEDIVAKKLELGLIDPVAEKETRRKAAEAAARRSAEASQEGRAWREGPAIVRPPT